MQFAAQTSTRVPIFSEKAQIITVDTLDGLACTHEARRHVQLLVNDFLSSMCIFSPPSPTNQVAVPPGCTYEPLKPRTGPPVKVRENCFAFSTLKEMGFCSRNDASNLLARKLII